MIDLPVYCPHCGAVFPDVDLLAGKIQCLNCNKKYHVHSNNNAANEVLCPKCGYANNATCFTCEFCETVLWQFIEDTTKERTPKIEPANNNPQTTEYHIGEPIKSKHIKVEIPKREPVIDSLKGKPGSTNAKDSEREKKSSQTPESKPKGKPNPPQYDKYRRDALRIISVRDSSFKSIFIFFLMTCFPTAIVFEFMIAPQFQGMPLFCSFGYFILFVGLFKFAAYRKKNIRAKQVSIFRKGFMEFFDPNMRRFTSKWPENNLSEAQINEFQRITGVNNEIQKKEVKTEEEKIMEEKIEEEIKKKIKEKEIPLPDYRELKCAFCGGEFRYTYGTRIVCKKCGASFLGRNGKYESTGKYFCRQCSAINLLDEMECKKCGKHKF